MTCKDNHLSYFTVLCVDQDQLFGVSVGLIWDFLWLCVLSLFSRVRLFATLWTVALQAPLPMEFSRQEYWNGLPCSPPGDLSDPGIEPTSLMSPVLANGFLSPVPPGLLKCAGNSDWRGITVIQLIKGSLALCLLCHPRVTFLFLM